MHVLARQVRTATQHAYLTGDNIHRTAHVHTQQHSKMIRYHIIVVFLVIIATQVHAAAVGYASPRHHRVAISYGTSPGASAVINNSVAALQAYI